MKALQTLFRGFCVIVLLGGVGLAAAAEPESQTRRLSPGKVAALSLIPGEGQFYNRQPRKGWFFLGAEAAALTGVGVAATNAQKEWNAYHLSSSTAEERYHLYNYRQQQLIKRDFIYVFLLIKAAAALDAYVDAHFFELDYRGKKISLSFAAGKVNLSTSFVW